jgi:hypothetical protein
MITFIRWRISVGKYGTTDLRRASYLQHQYSASDAHCGNGSSRIRHGTRHMALVNNVLQDSTIAKLPIHSLLFVANLKATLLLLLYGAQQR